MEDSITHVWSVTYHDGTIDDVKAHAFANLNGRCEFRDSNGDLLAIVESHTYRSIIRVDALVEADVERQVDADETAYLLGNEANAGRLLGAVERLESVS